jgi:hypothetical protein
MAKVASISVALGALGAAVLFFIVGLVAASGEHGHVYWAVRGPIWGLAVLSLILGGAAAWLAWRTADG